MEVVVVVVVVVEVVEVLIDELVFFVLELEEVV